MFTAILNFFKGFFSNKAVTQLIVKDIAFRTFKRRPRLANKAMTWCNIVLNAIKVEAVSTVPMLQAFMLKSLGDLELTAEEKMLLGTLMDNLSEQLTKELNTQKITEPLKQLGKAAEFIEWIMDAAKAAGEAK